MQREINGTSTEGWKGFKRIIKDATRVCRHEARPEREGDLRGRGGRIEMEKRAEQSHQKRGGNKEDSEREPGRKMGRGALASPSQPLPLPLC